MAYVAKFYTRSLGTYSGTPTARPGFTHTRKRQPPKTLEEMRAAATAPPLKRTYTKPEPWKMPEPMRQVLTYIRDANETREQLLKRFSPMTLRWLEAHSYIWNGKNGPDAPLKLTVYAEKHIGRAA